jgi:alpha-1,6-mannosyltransferase
LEFPGVVPRTSIGAFVIALPCSVVLSFTETLGFTVPKFYEQLIVRITLAIFVVWASSEFRAAVSRLYGNSVATFCWILTLSQFHGLYYASRTLPNVFAYVLVVYAFSHWFLSHEDRGKPSQLLSERHFGYFIRVFVVAGVIFRSELIILFAPIVLTEIFIFRRQPFFTCFKISIQTASLALMTTVVFDSWFWQRLIYPEAELLYFNVFLNKSHEWGVSPWHYYFTRHLPALLLAAYPLSFLAVTRDVLIGSSRKWLWIPMVAFVSLYSILGHKEWRFIFYTVPLWNVLAASVLDLFCQNRTKTVIYRLLYYSSFLAVLLGTCIVLLFAQISSFNYPGGVALSALHENLAVNQNVYVHIDVYSAMTGISRFGERRKQVDYFSPILSTWRYSKDEHLENETQYSKFTHLITSAPKNYTLFKILTEIVGYDGVYFERSPSKWVFNPFKLKYGPLQINLAEKAFILHKSRVSP